MQSRYKIVISSRNIYKEVELAGNIDEIKVGTGADCGVRLRKELFFENIEISFIRREETWSIICSDNIYFTVGDLRKLITRQLEHGDELVFKYQNSNSVIFNVSFALDFDYEKKAYDLAIDLNDVKRLAVGGEAHCQVILRSPYVGKDGFIIEKENNNYYLRKGNSKYGIYLNGRRNDEDALLKENDFISLANFSFCFLKGKLYTTRNLFMEIKGLKVYEVCESRSEHVYPKFNRSTRLKSVVSTEKIPVKDPSAAPSKPKGNIVMQLFPALAMLAVTVVVRGMMSSSSNSSFILLSVCTMSIGIISSVVGIINDKKEYKKDTKERIEKYNKYIAETEAEIQKMRIEEAAILEDTYFSTDKEIRMVDDFSANLFDRSQEDIDYLEIRLGTGKNEALRQVDFKVQEKYDCEDELVQLPAEIAEKYQYIENTPITLSLKGKNAVGIVGARENLYGLLKNITLDLATRHYYTELNLFYIIDEARRECFHWIRLLPHLYNDVLKSRNIVCDSDSKNVLFEYLYKELSRRESFKVSEPNIVIFAYDDVGLKSHPISKFVDKANELGVTFIFFEEHADFIPSRCTDIITLYSATLGVLVSASDKSQTKEFTFAPISDHAIGRMVNKLAPIYCEEVSLEGTLTKNITLFELLNIMTVEDINLKSNWASSRVYESMAAPLGVRTKNEVVYLDLHEKHHGPHGLVAGTTGSGKSEILQSYILSMSLLFHPYEVSFVIIDFKGGGMVNQFKDLPHLLGAITNIDGKEINRSLKSIKAELQKRQRLFAEADVNHIDKYIKKYKGGEIKVPLPHLIIIVDEFAELKAEQPEFMKELISAARIGRSLGVHLILATQKPSGQVNEQIWSNSKFKLCLKVQSQEDSKEVLKSPLAAEIKEPGRAYLQVGNNEIFELFQSAYSGGPAVRGDDTNQRKFKIYSIGLQGRKNLLYEKKKVDSTKNSLTELESIVKYIASFCTDNCIDKLSSICLPSLKDVILYRKITAEYQMDMQVPVGVYDDPEHQYQGIYWSDIGRENTLVVGSSQTGKTNLIQLCIRHFVENYTPQEVSFYILDFGSMVLKNFEDLYHVGGVVLASEDEKLKNFFKLMTQEIDFRKNKLMNAGVSSYMAYKEAGYNDLPKIYIIVDNFTAFKELYMDAYEQIFVRICRDGVSLGISVIITNVSATGIGYRHMTNFSNRICFTCNDSSEYGTLLDRCRMEPKNIAGRLLFQKDKEIYEAQSYLAFEGEKEIDRANAVKDFVKISNEKYGVYERAKRIPSIPDILLWKDFEKQYEDVEYTTELPLGLNFANIEPMYLISGDDCELSVISKKKEKVAVFIKGLLYAITKRMIKNDWNIYIIDGVERRLSTYKDNPLVARYCIDPSESELLFERILEEVRTNKEKVIEHGQTYKYAKNIVIINNKECIDYISKTKPVLDKYKELVENYKNYGIQIILSDIDNVAVPYSGPELLKRVKDNRKAIILDSLASIKVFEIPSGIVRNYSKQLLDDEAFYLYGSEVAKIKLIKEE